MECTLYAIDKKNACKVWTIRTEEDRMIISHGKLDGKMQEKVYTAKPKNTGKANATTGEEQAVKEAMARVTKQMDKGYRDSLEKAREAAEQQRLPMLASDYTKVGHSIEYPCLVSPKLDGVRCIARVEDSKVTLTSRGGKEYPVPEVLEQWLIWLSLKTEITCFDGELYIHGVSLQNIVSAVKKPNALTPQLQFWIFDIPSDEGYLGRLEALEACSRALRDQGSMLKVVLSEPAMDENHAREFMDYWLSEGFEGMMLRNLDGKYEWNHRSRDLQKWKDFKDLEAKVVDFKEDNLGEAVYSMLLPNGLICEAKPRGTHEQRSVKNVETYLGNWATIRYQQETDAGNLQFPVITGIRECDESGQPLE